MDFAVLLASETHKAGFRCDRASSGMVIEKSTDLSQKRFKLHVGASISSISSTGGLAPSFGLLETTGLDKYLTEDLGLDFLPIACSILN